MNKTSVLVDWLTTAGDVPVENKCGAWHRAEARTHFRQHHRLSDDTKKRGDGW